VAVRRSSRWDGYSWSGALNEPPAPLKDCSGWVWQLDGQWCRITVHESAEGGSGPSWASVAAPAKWTRSPTRQVAPGAGELMVAVGGVLPTVIVTAAVLDAPRASVTRRLAVKTPSVVYV
jgi:hypothetical protein